MPQKSKAKAGECFAVSRVASSQALRDVYRSMPFLDFSAFISFLLRTLHSIKASSSKSVVLVSYAETVAPRKRRTTVQKVEAVRGMMTTPRSLPRDLLLYVLGFAWCWGT